MFLYLDLVETVQMHQSWRWRLLVVTAAGCSRVVGARNVPCGHIMDWAPAVPQLTLVWVDAKTVATFLPWKARFDSMDGSARAVVAWDEYSHSEVSRWNVPVMQWPAQHAHQDCDRAFVEGACMRRYHELAASKLHVAACLVEAGVSVTVADVDAVYMQNLTPMLAGSGAHLATVTDIQAWNRTHPFFSQGRWGLPVSEDYGNVPGPEWARMNNCLALMWAKGGSPAAQLLRLALDIMTGDMRAWWEGDASAARAEARPPSRVVLQQSFAWALALWAGPELDLGSVRAAGVQAGHQCEPAMVTLTDGKRPPLVVAYLPWTHRPEDFDMRSCLEVSCADRRWLAHTFGTAEQKRAWVAQMAG